MKYIAIALGLAGLLVLGGCAKKTQPTAPVTAGHVTSHDYHGGKTGD